MKLTQKRGICQNYFQKICRNYNLVLQVMDSHIVTHFFGFLVDFRGCRGVARNLSTTGYLANKTTAVAQGDCGSSPK